MSHSETISVFQRACVRAGIKIKHSHGFNPHPKMSFVLPRSVGVESDDELLYIEIVCPADKLANCQSLSQIKNTLSRQLPDGCELFEVSAAEKKDRPQATMATYLFAVKEQYFSEELKNRAKC
ncbi:MAG: TIGR03936 family radical SAM-associated protein, partial [Planctomycetes bacterium]|nr:TIGR03936 family radical SAM-associated protein [Planctomycetota bacterium]